MISIARTQRSYDHRLRDLVRSAGDIGHATRRGVPRSTARGWLTSIRAEVVTLDVVDMDVLNLQQEVLALRKRVEWLVALLRLMVVMLKASGFSLACARVTDGATKVSLLRAIDRSRSVLPLRAVLSAKTFCTFVPEFSPRGLSSGGVEEDTITGRIRCSPDRVLIRQGFRHPES